MVHKREFFKLVRVKIEKQISEVQKQSEINVQNLDLG